MEKHKNKKRRKRYILLKFILLSAFCAGVYYFASSPFFDVDRLTVRNNSYYTEQQIIDLSEAETGGNLFRLSAEELKDRLLQDPYIKDARISKKLPGEIVIAVEERRETAAVPYGEEYVIIDREGIVLRNALEEPPITVFTGMTLSNIQAGTPLGVEESSQLSGALKLLRSMEEHDIYFKRIEFSGFLIKAYIYDGLVCEGSPENILKNMDDLEDVLYDLYVQGIERGVIKVGGNGYYSFSALVE
ncbi:cell division protein FtsQ/DivIB [Bacillota bacterium]